MCLTNRVYHRRALSYWFRIVCNSLYLPSRPFSSPLCFMWLSPFLIIVTDRRSGEKDGENERESRDFVTAVFVVCERSQLGGCGWRCLPYRSRPLPTPLSFLLFILGCIIQCKNGRHGRDQVQTITTDVQVCAQEGQKPCRLCYRCQWYKTHAHLFWSVLRQHRWLGSV